MEKTTRKIGRLAPYCYILPITVILVLFVITSVIISLTLGFSRYNIMTPPVFQGVENYRQLFQDIRFVKALKNTVKLMLLVVPVQMILGIAISVFLVANRNRFLGKLASCIIFIPFLCSSAVTGVVWRELLNGKLPPVEGFFHLFGISPALLLGNVKTAWIVVGLVTVWKWMGYYVVIDSSALLGIPQTYYEAAQIDGADRLQTFFRITLPILKPTLILTLFLSVISSLHTFDLIFNLTGGGPNNSTTTLVYYAYSLCFSSGKAGYAMAVSNVLFLMILAVVLVQQRWMKRDASRI